MLFVPAKQLVQLVDEMDEASVCRYILTAGVDVFIYLFLFRHQLVEFGVQTPLRLLSDRGENFIQPAAGDRLVCGFDAGLGLAARGFQSRVRLALAGTVDAN